MSWLCTLARPRDRPLAAAGSLPAGYRPLRGFLQSFQKGVNESQTVRRDAFREDLRSLLRQHLVALRQSAGGDRLAFRGEEPARNFSPNETPLEP
jgi:hypothetical protein